MRATERPSPNFNARKGGVAPSLIVLHYTAMDSAEAALERLCDPVHEVSAHYLIRKDGLLFRLVPEDCRAWHAGVGHWGGADDINSRSIGIELDNDGTETFSAPLMQSLTELLRDLLQRHVLPPKAVIGHQDMAPERKSDPGALFAWRALAEAGLSVWPRDVNWSAVDATRFESNLHKFGYPEGAAFDAVLTAFRDRFRSGHTGQLDQTDMALAQDLADRFPFDRAETPD